MRRKNILYIQFYTGELAKIEQRGCVRTAGDLAQFKFVSAEKLDASKIDLIKNFDQVIIGPGAEDYPFNTYKVREFAEELITTNYPTLGIGLGQLLLADLCDFEVGRNEKNAETDQITDFTVRSSQSELSPVFEINLKNSQTPLILEFPAYTNHVDSVLGGDTSKIIISSEKNLYAGIAFKSKVFGIQFLPFLDQVTYYWWKRPYPDFWKNLKGFWEFKNLRENKFANNLITKLTHKLLAFSPEEYTEEQAWVQRFNAGYKDLSKSQIVLRNFITKIHRTKR